MVTFARFYAVHVLLLPPATMLLIWLTSIPGAQPRRGARCRATKCCRRSRSIRCRYSKTRLAIFLAFAILFTLAVAAQVPLEQLADPTDTTYIPRPNGISCFCFRRSSSSRVRSKLSEAPFCRAWRCGAFLVPFVDRGQMVKVTRRTRGDQLRGCAAGIGWSGLTAAAVAIPKPREAVAQVDYSAPTNWIQLSPEEMAGIAYFRQENCVAATRGRIVTGSGPESPAVHKDAAWMIRHFKQPAAVRPGSSACPPVALGDAQLNSLAAFLLKLNPENSTALAEAPEFAVRGAHGLPGGHCAACHMVNGVGMKVGPPLNGLAKRQTRSWVDDHFANPQKLSPGSIMPPYQFSDEDKRNLTAYLFSLPE